MPDVGTGYSGIFGPLMDAARCGDWSAVAELTANIRAGIVPELDIERQEYLRALKETLVVVKAARAGIAVSAARLSAAVGFQNCYRNRQHPGVSTEF
jgi:hypothetical protein